jgi:hypothetical protein
LALQPCAIAAADSEKSHLALTPAVGPHHTKDDVARDQGGCKIRTAANGWECRRRAPCRQRQSCCLCDQETCHVDQDRHGSYGIIRSYAAKFTCGRVPDAEETDPPRAASLLALIASLANSLIASGACARASARNSAMTLGPGLPLSPFLNGRPASCSSLLSAALAWCPHFVCYHIVVVRSRLTP